MKKTLAFLAIINFSFILSMQYSDYPTDDRTNIEQLKKNYQSPLDAIQSGIDYVESMKYDMEEYKELNIVNREVVCQLSREQAEREYEEDFSIIMNRLLTLQRVKREIVNLLNSTEKEENAHDTLGICFHYAHRGLNSISNKVDPKLKKQYTSSHHSQDFHPIDLEKLPFYYRTLVSYRIRSITDELLKELENSHDNDGPTLIKKVKIFSKRLKNVHLDAQKHVNRWGNCTLF